MIVKVLGVLDIAAAITFLVMIFGFDVHMRVLLFFACLLMLKGFFMFTGDVLSVIDLFAAVILIIAIFTHPFSVVLWLPSLLLFAKGLWSLV